MSDKAPAALRARADEVAASAATPRIPDAEMTAFPWWVIVDPPTIWRLEGREHVEVDGENGVREEDLDDDGMMACRHLTPGDIAFAVTGPFFSRTAAQAHLDARRHAFGPRAAVWCHSGHASPDWRAFCREPESHARELAATLRELADAREEVERVTAERDALRALRANAARTAAEAIYFADSADYIRALWTIVAASDADLESALRDGVAGPILFPEVPDVG